MTMMPGATLNFTDALNLTRSLLNASDGAAYTTNDDTNRHPDLEIIDALRGADGLVYSLIGSTEDHPKRNQFIVATTTAIAHAGLIPNHIGSIGAVLIGGKEPQVLAAGEIERLRSSVLTILEQGPYYDVIDNRLFYYPGTAATVDIFPPYSNTGAALSVPSEYFDLVVALALAKLFGKEGAEVEAAQFYKGYAELCMGLVAKGETAIPSVIGYQRS